MPRPIAAAQQTWWQNHTLCLMTTGNTTQGSVFRPIITPFRRSRPSKAVRQTSTKDRRPRDTKREQSDKSKPASPLPIVPASMCFLLLQHAATVQTSLWQRARRASFPSPWHDRECESRESHNSGHTQRDTSETSSCPVRQSRTAPHHSACFHCHSVQLQSLHMFLLKFPCFFS